MLVNLFSNFSENDGISEMNRNQKLNLTLGGRPRREGPTHRLRFNYMTLLLDLEVGSKCFRNFF